MMPKISGSGSDDHGAFTLSATSNTDLYGSNTFWKTYTTGDMVQYDVAFEAGSGSTGSFTAKGSYTSTSKAFVWAAKNATASPTTRPGLRV